MYIIDIMFSTWYDNVFANNFKWYIRKLQIVKKSCNALITGYRNETLHMNRHVSSEYV